MHLLEKIRLFAGFSEKMRLRSARLARELGLPKNRACLLIGLPLPRGGSQGMPATGGRFEREQQSVQ